MIAAFTQFRKVGSNSGTNLGIPTLVGFLEVFGLILELFQAGVWREGLGGHRKTRGSWIVIRNTSDGHIEFDRVSDLTPAPPSLKGRGMWP